MKRNEVSVSLEDIYEAKKRLEGVIEPTPMEKSRNISERTGFEVLLKCENLNRAGSFKIRGAYNRIARLSEEEKKAGIVAASAGNHAQGVALAAQLLGIKATVFMPGGASVPKLLATQAYGAEVRQKGRTIDDSLQYAREFEKETGSVLIHPFDHEDIVAGQGTCGLEILEQCPDVKTIVVSLGGGGLTAGIAMAVKSLRPDLKIIAVQAEGAAAYPRSLEEGRPVLLEEMTTMADGIAVGCPGKIPFEIVRQLVDEIVVVSENDLSRALLFILERSKLVVEPAGAAAVAYLLREPQPQLDGPVVAVLSGGNIDPVLLMRIIRHGMAAAGRYMQFWVKVPDMPGNLAQLLTDIASMDANVLEVEHTRIASELLVDEVEINIEIETQGFQHRAEVLEFLRNRGYDVYIDEKIGVGNINK